MQVCVLCQFLSEEKVPLFDGIHSMNVANQRYFGRDQIKLLLEDFRLEYPCKTAKIGICWD